MTTAALAVAYRDRPHPGGGACRRDVRAARDALHHRQTRAEDIAAAKAAGVVALKLYPAGRRPTRTQASPTSAGAWRPSPCSGTACCCWCTGRDGLRRSMSSTGKKAFIDHKLIALRRDFPGLKVVFEHITTLEAAHHGPPRARAWPRPSRRSICCTTATPSSPVASGLTYCLPILEARRASSGAGESRDLGLGQVLPGH